MVAFVGVCLYVIYDNRTRYSRKSLNKVDSNTNSANFDPESENPYSSNLMIAITKSNDDSVIKGDRIPSSTNKDESDIFSESNDFSLSIDIDEEIVSNTKSDYVKILDDNILIIKYLEGNEKSLEVLVDKHKQRIYSFIYSKILDKDISEDIFQDTFIKVLSILGSGNYNKKDVFLPWVMRISHNLIIDHFRKSNRLPSFKSTEEFDIFSVLGDRSLKAEKQVAKNQIHESIDKLIELLPEDQKEVLIMRIYKDMSFKEISESTGVSINIALGRMRYALINLRKVIDSKQIVK